MQQTAYRKTYIHSPENQGIEPWHGPFDLTRLRPEHFTRIDRSAARDELDEVLQKAVRYGAAEAAVAEARALVESTLACEGTYFKLVWTRETPTHEFSHILDGEWLEVVCFASFRVHDLITFFD